MLAEHGIDYERRDYFRDAFTADELRTMLDGVGLRPSDVLSKRSRAYKELELAERDAGEDELLELMVEHPALLRRPILVREGQAVVGYDKESIESLIE